MDIMELLVPKELVICKACGYVMGKNSLKDKCPACGVAAKMFEPFTEKISPYRKLVLTLDIHPVLVHFPQAFTFTVMVLAAICLVMSGGIRDMLMSAFKILSACLPFTVLISAAAGMFDGKIRFRKIRTPLLIRKISISCLFLLLSLGILWLALFTPLARAELAIALVLSMAAFACSAVLGLIGVRLLNSKFQG